MSLKNKTYSVLAVSAAESFNASLLSLLPESTYHPIHIVSDISSAKRAFAEREFDYIIINSPLPDDFGIHFAIDAVAAKSTVVLLLVRTEIHAEIYDKVAEHGVFTLPKPTARPNMLTALGWMAVARERLRKFENKTVSIEERMEEIRLINRAKWQLINEFKMDEPTAHRYIEKQAMDRCVSKREIAEEILKSH